MISGFGIRSGFGLVALPPINSALPRVRLDVWLDVACLFRTRSEAQKACKGGKVEVNDQRGKPHREVQVGDQIVITGPMGRRRQVVILSLAEQHLRKTQARELYQDLTPPPSPEEIELRRLARVWGMTTRPRGAGSPDKRERRMLRRLKGN